MNNIEIERKFLVNNDSWMKESSLSYKIQQGYLTSNPSIRVRIYDEKTAKLTIKSAEPGTTRIEYEYDIPLADAIGMMESLPLVGIIDKTRHLVIRDGVTWEIDVFHKDSDGLVIAEVELSSEHQAIADTEWLGVEVTHDKRYYNNDIALTPYCEW